MTNNLENETITKLSLAEDVARKEFNVIEKRKWSPKEEEGDEER